MFLFPLNSLKWHSFNLLAFGIDTRWRDVKLRAFDNVKHRTYVDLKVIFVTALYYLGFV